MSGFFGFPTELPERRGPSLNHTPLSGFHAANTQESFAFSGAAAGEEEDIAVYTWGEGLNDNTLDEGDDDFNDETFGGNGAVGQLRFPLSRAWAKRRAQYEVRG